MKKSVRYEVLLSPISMEKSLRLYTLDAKHGFYSALFYRLCPIFRLFSTSRHFKYDESLIDIKERIENATISLKPY